MNTIAQAGSTSAVLPSPGAFESLRGHWREYLMEAWGLAMFIVFAHGFLTILEYPPSPVHQTIAAKWVRMIIIGLGMGGVVAGIIYSPWGKRSGAHINPSVTWAFYRLGKIGFWDAVFYTAAQFLGAVVTVQILRLLIGSPYRHQAVDHGLTMPGPGGPWVAFAAEFGISFVLMLVVLFAVNRPSFEKRVGAIVGVLIALYLILETPLSGMSLNPARSFGSALAAGKWSDLWVYFTAPPLAMLLAAELYVRWQHQHLDGPDYPVENADK